MVCWQGIPLTRACRVSASTECGARSRCQGQLLVTSLSAQCFAEKWPPCWEAAELSQKDG